MTDTSHFPVVHVTGADRAFLGVDLALVYTIYKPGTKLKDILNGTATAEDITGWTLYWVLILNGVIILTKTTALGIVLTVATAGVATVSIADTDTDAFAPTTYTTALMRTDAGNECVVGGGEFTFLRKPGT